MAKKHMKKCSMSLSIREIQIKIKIIQQHEKKVKVKSLNHVQLFVNPWTVAYQAPPIIGFSRQKYWSGLPFPSPEDFPKPAMNLGLLHWRQTLYHLRHQSSSSVQSLSRVRLFVILSHESQHARLPCPSPTPRVYSNSCTSSW